MIKQRIAIGLLSLSAMGLLGIALDEGYVEVAKPPVAGDVPTNGFGSTEGVKAGDRTTPTKAIQRLVMDSAKYEGVIKQCVTVPLYQHEYDAYASLAYNIGPVAFCRSTLVKKLNSDDYRGACEEIKRWDRFQGKPMRGLTERRQREFKRCIGNA